MIEILIILQGIPYLPNTHLVSPHQANSNVLYIGNKEELEGGDFYLFLL
jgi:hypothetical protein